MLGEVTIDGMVEDEFRSSESYPLFDAPGPAERRDPAQPDADPDQEPQGWSPPEESHVSGTELRRRIVTEQSIAELEATRKPGLLQRIFGRK